VGTGFHPELTEQDAKHFSLNGATLRVGVKRVFEPNYGIIEMDTCIELVN